MPKILTIIITLLTVLLGEPVLGQDSYVKCPNPNNWVIKNIDAKLGNHKNWLLKRGHLDPKIPGRANFCNANLSKVNLSGANLSRANLRGSSLLRANLQGANLAWADLNSASLFQTDLRGANLIFAKMQSADLISTDLEGANLSGANLDGASFRQTNLTDTKFVNVSLVKARFEPATVPTHGSLSGIEGLQTVRVCPPFASGLVQLRTQLKTAGLRKLEREATYAIERSRTHHDLRHWFNVRIMFCRVSTTGNWGAIEGLFRLAFFEWTTDYGLAYGRPILILFGLIGAFSVIYLLALIINPRRIDAGGIYRIWPEGRIERRGAKLVQSQDVIIERLQGHGFSTLGYALYFSVVSAFHLGWRDLNVGTWIARLQPREYALRAKGWVRVVSGIQSLISVYLIAMWVLTYFGRPFG